MKYQANHLKEWYVALEDGTQACFLGKNAETHAHQYAAMLNNATDMRKRAAELAWKMQAEQFGGGTAIGNAIQDLPL